MRKISLLCLILCLAATGCVVREMLVRSEPPGAKVFIDTEEKGVTPCTVPFTFYGGREIVLRKDGYVSAKKVVAVSIPWYEYFPLDFISEIMIPFRIRDTHAFDFKLEKIPAEGGTEEILKRAKEEASGKEYEGKDR